VTGLVSFYQAHPSLVALGGYYIVSAFIGALPAPMAGSSQLYLFFYKFLNTLGGNLTRAFGTKVEKSPNFADAVQKMNGGT